MACDPHWTSYLTAVSTPIVAIGAAVTAGIIASRQAMTARNKLRLDLFEKRLAIFETATRVFEAINDEEWDTGLKAANTALRVVLPQAKWLFDESVAQSLDELYKKGRRFWVLDQERTRHVRIDDGDWEFKVDVPPEREIEIGAETGPMGGWFVQRQEALSRMVEPFLRLQD